MGYTSSAVKRRYNDKAYDRFEMVFKKGLRDRYKAFAESNGETLAGMIKRFLEAETGIKDDS